jgi:fatty-acyl-CoA synthase
VDLSDLIARNAAFTPDKPALHFDGETLSYAAFTARIETTARALKSEYGIARGDRVAILSLNRPDYLVLLYACARLGAMLVPLYFRLAVAEQLFILSDATIKVLFVEQAFADVIAPLGAQLPEARIVGLDFTPAYALAFNELLQRANGDGRNPHVDLTAPLLIVYTSGTTGRPKGAVLRQEALLWNGVMSQHMHSLTSDDHVLTVLVPATILAVTSHPAWATTDLTSLKAISTGSQIVPQDLIDRITARGVPVLQVYGSTETCPVAVYTRLNGDLSRNGSTGLPGLCCEARVIDDNGEEVATGTPGEIVVRGPNVFFEYWGNEAATREALHDGWFRTGDIAARDADGYFFVHDRKKNMIISGGENIYAAEIERVLLEHPDVADCGVIGRPDPKWDEVPVAYVIRRAGRAPRAEDLAAHALAQLARFKVPREFVFVDELPRTALGKVQHFRLKQIAEK